MGDHSGFFMFSEERCIVGDGTKAVPYKNLYVQDIAHPGEGIG